MNPMILLAAALALAQQPGQQPPPGYPPVLIVERHVIPRDGVMIERHYVPGQSRPVLQQIMPIPPQWAQPEDWTPDDLPPGQPQSLCPCGCGCPVPGQTRQPALHQSRHPVPQVQRLPASQGWYQAPQRRPPVRPPQVVPGH